MAKESDHYLEVELRELLKNGESQLFMRYQSVLEQKKGFSSITDSALLASPNSRYLGSEPKLYTRYRYKYGRHLSFGFTCLCAFRVFTFYPEAV